MMSATRPIGSPLRSATGRLSNRDSRGAGVMEGPWLIGTETVASERRRVNSRYTG
jgi:hypothetical protein